uniref:probable myosin light chain kinase DDB_G0284661 isoform X2 n=1 Tax=Ciona intestinalis TaxID=7719 RepID=UPI000180B544|nr:probable myosin light chain kinase DDB_G0284661 isoform X2 [Ciona intestinalis]|eukprot:XP_018669193.1 probable myosin light chain kinase DDB_G0284661 isoform X2 [Ciona intestinalis]
MARRKTISDNDECQFGLYRRRQPKRPTPVFSAAYANRPIICTNVTQQQARDYVRLEQEEPLPSQIITPRTNVQRVKQVKDCLGKVAYGMPEHMVQFSKYWGELAAQLKKNRSPSSPPISHNMTVDSEGVILNKALRIDHLSYGPNAQYMRVSPNWQAQGTSGSIKDVGFGQYGRVFHVVDVASQREGHIFDFAEKIIPLDRFNENELNILCSVDHKNIVKCYGGIKTVHGIHILMQFAPGGNIDQLLRENSNAEPAEETTDNRLRKEFWALEYYKQVMSALQYLHTHYIVHCDVKASNVMLSSDQRRCFLTDFGETMRVPQGEEYVKLDNVVGTEAYMSPEVIEFQVYNLLSDVWSAACFLLNMITRKQPWSISCPNLGTYMYIIPQRPFKILKEIPDWVQGNTLRILESSFVDVSKRIASTELLMLAGKAIEVVSTVYQSLAIPSYGGQSTSVEIESCTSSIPYESTGSEIIQNSDLVEQISQQQSNLEQISQQQSNQPSCDVGFTPESPEKHKDPFRDDHSLEENDSAHTEVNSSVSISEEPCFEHIVQEELAEPMVNTDNRVDQQLSPSDELEQLLNEHYCEDEETSNIDPNDAAEELDRLLAESELLNGDIESDSAFNNRSYFYQTNIVITSASSNTSCKRVVPP